jgi:hypothetical protein
MKGNKYINKTRESFAERIRASPGNEEYNSPSLCCQGLNRNRVPKSILHRTPETYILRGSRGRKNLRASRSTSQHHQLMLISPPKDSISSSTWGLNVCTGVKPRTSKHPE